MPGLLALIRSGSLLSLILAAGALAVGCGDEQSEPAEAPPEATLEAPEGEGEAAAAEPEDPPAEVPSSWRTLTNRSAGFSIGVPPRWESRPAAGGEGTELTDPSGATRITVIADRTEAGMNLRLEELARQTAQTLGGTVGPRPRLRDLVVGRVAPFDHTYEASAVRAVGEVAGSKEKEQVLVASIRREDLASFVAIVRRNADQGGAAIDRGTVKRVIRSLRSRPPA